MKKIIFGLLIIGSPFLYYSCSKKEKTPEPQTSNYSKADDASGRNEMDRAFADIESVYKTQEYGNAKMAAVVLPCGKVTLNSKNFTIDYNGVNCGARVLSGTIDVALISGTKFSDVDAVLKVTFNNYKVLYNANNQSIVYNGIAVIKNNSGGSLVSLFTGASNVEIIHKVRADLELTFDTLGTGGNTLKRDWHVFRKRTYSNISGTSTGIKLTIEGDTSSTDNSYIEGSYASISEYGLNREGKKFINNVGQAFVWENCGSSYDGPYVLKKGAFDFTVHVGYLNPLLSDVFVTLSAAAGYSFSSTTGSYQLVNDCSSNGYKLNYKLRQGFSSTTPIYNVEAFQPY